MAKYRLLSKEELQELEKEFVEYLIINGITSDDWVKIKKDHPGKAEQIIELFSDVVFESILRKCNYMEYRNTHEIKCFQCLENKLVLVAMIADPAGHIDFTNKEFIKEAATNPPAGLKIFTTEKAYDKKREDELFEMLQSGCIISDGNMFKTLCMVLPPA